MTTQSTHINSRGASFVEFVLILPILLLVLGGGFEFTMLFKAKQNLSNLASLTGGAAFRACANLLGGTQTTPYKNCFAKFLENSKGLTQSILPATEIVLSLYESTGAFHLPPGSEGINLTAKKLGQYPPSHASFQSAYDKWIVSDAVSGISPENPRVLIAEFKYTYRPYLPIFEKFGPFVLTENGIY